MGLRASDYLINDETPEEETHACVVDGEVKMRGYVPRNYVTHAHCSSPHAIPFEALNLPLIPRSEWSDRIKEGEATKSFLTHVRRRANNGKPIPSLDQNQKGYCWAHSATMACIMSRAKMNQPYKRLSAFMVACILKNYRDEGGWGALALDFITENGVPTVETWPEKSMSRSNDNAAMRADAALHKVLAGYVDIDHQVFDRNLTVDQVMTLLLCRIPVIGDFNWWGHSVCLLDPVEIEAGSFGPRGINSWTDSYGDLGEFVLQGRKAVTDGAVAPRSIMAA